MCQFNLNGLAACLKAEPGIRDLQSVSWGPDSILKMELKVGTPPALYVASWLCFGYF